VFTPNSLRALMTRRPDAAAAAYPYLSAAMREFSIVKRLREAAFLATIAHESAELRYTSEIWGPTPEQQRYEPPSAKAKELGNTEPGDGFRFRGRSPIEITGRDNYAAVSEALGHDFVASPDDLALPEYAFRASAWWWQDHHCNELADLPDFAAVTHRVNGGMNGWEQRLDYYKRALVLIPIDAPANFSDVVSGVATTAPKDPP
jgi:putative chitinase